MATLPLSVLLGVIGPWQIVLVVVVLLLLFGGKKIPELTKIKKSAGKRLEGAPHDVLLVLDATTGQNAIEQATQFTESTDVTRTKHDFVTFLLELKG